jgi:integrase
MAKKITPPGNATPEQIYEAGSHLPLRDRAFLYGLFLLGCRTNELCRIRKGDLFLKEGEYWFRAPVSKKKKPGEWRSWPVFVFPPTEAELTMFADFKEFHDSAPETDGLLFGFTSTNVKRSWPSKKTGEVKTKTYLTFKQPYYRLTVKAKVSAVLDGKSGQIERTIPPHYIRSFAITHALNANPTDPLFTTEWIGHSDPKTTFGYWTRSGEAWKLKRKRLWKDALQANTLPPTPQQQEETDPPNPAKS